MNNNNNSVSDNYHCNISSKQKLVINFPYFHKMYVYFNTNLEFRVTKTMTYLLLHYLPSVVSHYSLTNKNLVRSNWHPQQITESQITIQSLCYNHHHLQRERARQTEGWRSEVGFGTMKDQATNPYEKDYSDSNNPTMTSKKISRIFFLEWCNWFLIHAETNAIRGWNEGILTIVLIMSCLHYSAFKGQHTNSRFE